MSIAFFWCHTWGCPDYGRPRRLEAGDDTSCPYCRADRKTGSPDDHALNTAAPGETP